MRTSRLLCVLTFTHLAILATPVSAQVVVRRAPQPQGGLSPQPAGMPVSEPEDSALLPQAGLNVAEGGATVSLQAFEFMISANTRFYLRSTLPVTSDAPQNPQTEPSEALRAGILDPFGGLLNASLGVYRERGTSARVALDGRAGIKLLETPKPADEVEAGEVQYEPKPFFTSMAMLKADLPLWQQVNVGDPAGTLTLAVSVNVTTAGSKDYLASLIDVDQTTANVTTHAAINLPGIFYITIDGTPWSSNAGIGKRFAFSVNAMRK